MMELVKELKDELENTKMTANEMITSLSETNEKLNEDNQTLNQVFKAAKQSWTALNYDNMYLNTKVNALQRSPDKIVIGQLQMQLVQVNYKMNQMAANLNQVCQFPCGCCQNCVYRNMNIRDSYKVSRNYKNGY